MSYYWGHDGDLDRPPAPKDVVVRRPITGDYWETEAFYRDDALETFWRRWARETGNPLPGRIPKEGIPTIPPGRWVRGHGNRRKSRPSSDAT